MRRNDGQPATRNLATLLALLTLLGLAGGLLLLIGSVLSGAAAGILGIVFGFVFLGVFHYVAWGWWLPAILPRPDEEDD